MPTLNITEWGNTEDRGIVISGLIFSPQWYRYASLIYPYSSSLPPINAAFAILISLALSISIYYFIWNKMPSSPREKNFLFSQSLLWSAIMIITQLDVVIIYNELEALVVWCSAGTCSDSAAVSKFYLIGYVALFNAIFFIVFLVYYLRGKLRPKQHLLPGFQPFFTGIPLIGEIVAIAILIFRLLIQPFQRKCRSVRYGAIHVYETLHYFITCPKWLLWNVFRLIKFLVIFLHSQVSSLF